MSELLNVDEIAPPTPELERLARRRVNGIVQEWARRLSIWGTDGLHDGKGGRVEQTFSIADLAIASYVQGVRDTAAVNATHPVGEKPPEEAR